MTLVFKILAALDIVLLGAAFLYQSPGEDPAGAGLRLGFAVIFAVLLAGALLLYHFVATPWVRVPVLIVLALPILSMLYGVWLSGF